MESKVVINAAFLLNKNEKLEDVLEELSKNPNNIIHIISNDAAKLENLPLTEDKNTKAVIFKGALGNYRQLEGMLAVSRILTIDDIERRKTELLYFYKILTGKTL